MDCRGTAGAPLPVRAETMACCSKALGRDAPPWSGGRRLGCCFESVAGKAVYVVVEWLSQPEGRGTGSSRERWRDDKRRRGARGLRNIPPVHQATHPWKQMVHRQRRFHTEILPKRHRMRNSPDCVPTINWVSHRIQFRSVRHMNENWAN